MNKMTEKVMRFICKQIKDAEGNLKEMDSKKAKQSFSFWAEWNMMDYVAEEFRLGLWTEMQSGLVKRVESGMSWNEIMTWVEDVREYYLEQIMNGYAQHSTNQIANMIEAKKIDVYRKAAGKNLVDSGSLAELISGLRRD